MTSTSYSPRSPFLHTAIYCRGKKGLQHCPIPYLTHGSLAFQVQSCSNTAKFLAHRVGGAENVIFPDDETTFEQLHARINRTIEILESLEENSMDGAETKEIILQTGMGNFQFTGQDYVTMFVIPNFHFHLSTGYCLLRSMGVDVGALDYMKDVFHKVEE